MQPLDTNEQFFYNQAGWSYDPKTETSEQGKARCAKLLAQAESFAKRAGMRFEWSKDDITNRTSLMPGLVPNYDKSIPAYRLWQVVAYLNGEICGSLGGVDFGPTGRPKTDPYGRVVEAELAVESFLENQESEAMACRDIATL